MIPDTPQLTLAPIHIGSDDCSMIASCAHAAPSSSALETSSSCAAPSLTAAEAVARSLGAAVDVDVAVFSPLTDTALAASAQSQLAQCQRDAAESAAARSLQHWGCATAAQLHFTSVQPAHALAAEMRTPHRASTHGASLQRALQLLRHNQERRELDTLWQLASMAAASVLRSAAFCTRLLYCSRDTQFFAYCSTEYNTHTVFSSHFSAYQVNLYDCTFQYSTSRCEGHILSTDLYYLYAGQH